MSYSNLTLKIVVAFPYSSVLNLRPSVRALTFGITNSFKYEKLLEVVISVQYISVSI